MDDKKIRLQKYLSMCGVASRRKSEELITKGLVSVNGKIVNQLGTVVSTNDCIKYNGNICVFSDKVYYVLNKPKNYMCSVGDNRGSRTIYEIINTDKKLFSIGRLDYRSEGLIILTNDGDFSNNLIHPSKKIVKEYLVESDKKPPQDLMDSFLEGIEINGITYNAKAIKNGIEVNVLYISLVEGKKREIREVYKHFEVNIKRLIRIKIGNMTLDKLALAEGKYISLTKNKIEDLIYGKKN